jgi:Mg/Co/Ni transporter MgtE
MDPRAPFASVAQTVQDGLQAIEDARDGALNYLYVIDEGRLVGVISIRELLSSKRTQPLSEVMRDAPARV